ncbi:MAG TPA: hypothetical protein VH475_08135 [Tepidisphaeraceae bacterium]|jgi:hypothetical protein
MFRSILYCVVCCLILGPLARAGKIETNVTLSSYWVSNYKYFHSNSYVNLEGVTGTAWPDTKFRGKFRADFIGPMTVTVDWNHVTKRQLMSVRGMSWGMVDFGDGRGGPNKYWAEILDKKTNKWNPVKGVWYLYVDRDIRPGSYPKIQLMPQTRPANWYRGYKRSYYQVPFPQMAADHANTKIVANNGDFIPMGAVFKITKLGTNLHNVPYMNAFLTGNKFEVLDMGVSGRGMDVHQGLQYFEAEDLDKYSLFMPGSTCHDTRGATIEILGVQASNGVFTAWDKNGKPIGTAPMPK